VGVWLNKLIKVVQLLLKSISDARFLFGLFLIYSTSVHVYSMDSRCDNWFLLKS